MGEWVSEVYYLCDYRSDFISITTVNVHCEIIYSNRFDILVNTVFYFSSEFIRSIFITRRDKLRSGWITIDHNLLSCIIFQASPVMVIRIYYRVGGVALDMSIIIDLVAHKKTNI
ncbi:hypothetical protein QTP88_009419 [Uroleucon formosanum]